MLILVKAWSLDKDKHPYLLTLSRSMHIIPPNLT